MDRNEIVNILENVFTSTEAAEYLNISTQRLNQLVHDGQLLPVKSSKSVLLFYKEDLDKRKFLNFANSNVQNNKEKTKYNSVYLKEALFFYTIQQFFNNNDKKTIDFLNEVIKKEKSFNNKDLSFGVIAKYLNISEKEINKEYDRVAKCFDELDSDVVISKKGDDLYSKLLNAVANEPPYIFMKGNCELINDKGVCVVGSRNASDLSKEKTDLLVKSLVKRNITIIAGLAKGIDTQAHKSALQSGGKTIAVIGSPINQYYPKENKQLQQIIEKDGLVISQFPPCNKIERWNFPKRNATMSGISLATIIMEAGETSGALIQADHALKQNRLVMIPNSLYNSNSIKWPKKYVERGAKTFDTLKDILYELNKQNITSIAAEDSLKREIKDVQMD